jgi:hypothetical protein
MLSHGALMCSAVSEVLPRPSLQHHVSGNTAPNYRKKRWEEIGSGLFQRHNSICLEGLGKSQKVRIKHGISRFRNCTWVVLRRKQNKVPERKSVDKKGLAYFVTLSQHSIKRLRETTFGSRGSSTSERLAGTQTVLLGVLWNDFLLRKLQY